MLLLHTLSQLRSGELVGIQHLTLSENLTTFPLEILALADSLKSIDLSNNQLSSLPMELSQLHQLKIIFASKNQFDTLPPVLGQCANLEMVGFKSNQIQHVPEDALPKKLRWLILTDNKIATLPDSLGERPLLQKLALAGNRLTELPNTLSNLHHLELLRISANQLSTFPEQLLELPKLAWLAFAGNPFTQRNHSGDDEEEEATKFCKNASNSVPVIPSASFTIQTLLGQGASGVISTATWNSPQNQFPNDIAVKVFKGEVTSDGRPKDELQLCLKAGSHPNLVKPLAQVNEPGYLALVMELIPAHYHNLGLPPSLKSCTRDTFPKGFSLTAEQVNKIIGQMQEVFEHLHNKHICHGDLYAHNTLFDQDANIIFGDFGAATMYHMLNDEQQNNIMKIEQRALDCFIEDLWSVCDEENQKPQAQRGNKQLSYPPY
ncbi:MAG: tRNA A-37 threonylcarbamoyl transferase component Bud32 [Candidatus Endobugula sp.]|jgi:tRNA A-37 threonylcarbamoyl transferase component Bud32